MLSGAGAALAAMGSPLAAVAFTLAVGIGLVLLAQHRRGRAVGSDATPDAAPVTDDLDTRLAELLARVSPYIEQERVLVDA